MRGNCAGACDSGNEEVDPVGLLQDLAEQGIHSVLVEIDDDAIVSFLESGLACKVTLVYSQQAGLREGAAEVVDAGLPKPLGGRLELRDMRSFRVGQDAILEGYPLAQAK